MLPLVIEITALTYIPCIYQCLCNVVCVCSSVCMCNLHNCSFYPLIKGVNYFCSGTIAPYKLFILTGPCHTMNLTELFLSIVFSSIAIHHTQLFARRGKFVKPGLEEDRWKEISFL